MFLPLPSWPWRPAAGFRGALLAATVLVLAASQATAQTVRWERILYSTPGVTRPEFVKRAVATPQGTVFCSMAATGNISSLRSHFWLLDAATGDSIWQRSGLPQFSGEQAARLLPNGNFGFVTEERAPSMASVAIGTYMQQFTPAGSVPFRIRIPYTQGSTSGGELGVALLPVAAPSGGYLLGSLRAEYSGSARNARLVSLTEQGAVRWARGYSWSRNDGLLDAQTDAQGRVVLYSLYLPDTGGGRWRLKLMQVDPVTGDSLRAATLTPAGTLSEPFANTPNHLLPLTDGGVILIGSVDTLTARGRRTVPFALKVDAQLNPVWTHLLRGPAGTSSPRYLNSVELQDGSMLMLADSGQTTSTYHLRHLNGSTGRLLGTYIYASTACSRLATTHLSPGADGRTIFVTGACLAPGGGYVARLTLPPGLASVVTAARPAAPTPTFTLYPNPARQQLTLQPAAPLPAGAALHLYSPLGQLVRRYALPRTGTPTLPLAGLPAGTYLARLCGPDGQPLGAARRLVVLP